MARVPVPTVQVPGVPAAAHRAVVLEHPGVRAVLGHWLFGYIHPFPGGNGRMARFVMNVMLASGGYPWTVILKEDRDKYLSALDAASIDMKIGPFSAFVAERVRWSMEHAPGEAARRR